MAKRLTARLSAGAALVTGLGMVGIAAATPAQAATVSLDYECTYTVLNIGEVPGNSNVSVDLTVDLPTEAKVGDSIESAVSAQVTIPDERRDSLYTLLGIRTIDGPNADEAAEDGNNSQDARNEANFSLSDGTTDLDGTMPLEIADTPVADSGDLVVDATGAVDPVTLEQEGTYTVTAGDFQGYIRGYNENGDYTTNITLDCSNTSEDATVGSVEVGPADDGDGDDGTEEPGDGDEQPAENDWFTEPSSLPITSDEKHFTVEGTASQAGVVKVVLLDADKNVLRADDWSVAEGSNTKDFPFAEGTDYVRLDSQECVDANGNTEADGSDAPGGNGCSVEYYAPWVNPDNGDDDGSDDDGSSDDGSSDDGAGDDASGDPEVPEVVQTDGFQRTAAPQQDNTLALTLGGLLLAGAGAGTVLVARRRAAAQH